MGRWLLISATVLFLLGAVAWGQEVRWLDQGATVRRLVTCEPAETRLPGDDLAVMTFYTAGKTKKNAEDIHVFAESDPPQRVPQRILSVDPGDQVRVAFATVKGVRRYHIYYGNSQEAAPARELEIRRGLLFEVHTGYAAKAESVELVEQMFARGAPQGVAFVDAIFFGYNPFGENESFVSRFTGYLNIDKPGEYRLATTSDGCSFVLLDDKPRNSCENSVARRLGPRRRSKAKGLHLSRGSIHLDSPKRVFNNYETNMSLWKSE